MGIPTLVNNKVMKILSWLKTLFKKDNDQYLCGCFEDKPDSRDYIKEIDSGVEPTYVNLLEGLDFTVTNQYSTNACTGHAMSAFLTILYHKLQKEEPIYFNYYWIYYWNRMLAFGNIKNDSGAFLRETMQACQKYGVLPKEFCSMNSVTSKPKDEEKPVAKLLAIKNYFRLPKDNIYKACIHTLVKEHLPILVAMWYRPNAWRIAGNTGVLHNITTQERQGGHAICIYGYDPEKDVFLSTNSWGQLWGNKGFFEIPKNTLENELMDAWTVEYSYF